MVTTEPVDGLIVYRNGHLLSICSPVEIVIFSGTEQKCKDALAERGYSESVLDRPPVDASQFWPTILSAWNADREAVIAENAELRSMVDALSAYVGELSSEIELNESKKILQKRIRQLELKISANIETYRRWIVGNTIPSFDVNNDELVRQIMLRDTDIGKEITYLRSVLDGNV